MKIIIEHGKTKRAIYGAFSFCCSNSELKQLKEIIDSKLNSDFSYGWINVDEFVEQHEDSEFELIKRQKQIPNTEPISWD